MAKKEERNGVRRTVAEKKATLLEALEKTGGIVTTAILELKKAGFEDTSRRQVYTWLENDPKFKKQAQECADKILDLAESSLINNIRAGDTTSIIFFLKTKGKHRGYIQKIENDVNGKIDVVWNEEKNYETDEKANNGT